MKPTILALTLFLFLLTAHPQVKEDNTDWMEYLQEMAENEEETTQVERLFEELSYLSENPFNLNTVTRNELEKLPFLSGIQVENIMYYTYRNAPLTSIYELKNIEGLDYQTIMYILPFVYIGEGKKQETLPDPKKILKYGKHQLFLRSDYCFQKKEGYKNISEKEKEENSNKYYLGEDYYLSFKYEFKYKDHLQLGLVGEKDQGEAFWNKHNKGFDFYSASLVVKNFGILKGLYLGDYRLSFGSGLVLNTDFSIGKTTAITNTGGKSNGGVKRHFSTGETGFFRGAAVSLALKQTTLNLFYSHQNVDANADSSNIYTFKTDGYNRTFNDLNKRNKATTNVLGTNLQWSNDFIKMGITAVYYDFGNKKLNPEEKAYNLYYLRGKNNYNLGMNYEIKRKKAYFQGEVAVSKNKGIATINTLQFSPAGFLDFIVSYRNYKKNYQALFGKSFSESSSIQNETGLYTGIKFRLLKYWELSSYIDYFQFPWLKYGVDAPSSGKDALVQLTYTPSQKMRIALRYKYKEKEKNATTGKTSSDILPYSQHRWKLQMDWKTGKGFDLRTLLDYNLYRGTDKAESNGWSIGQIIGYKFPKYPVRADLSLCYYHALDWNNRIVNYEKNILYAFSFPSYSGKGIRYYTTIKWDVTQIVTCYFKVSSDNYFNREDIGSGLEAISGKEKTNIQCLLKLKF